MSALWGAVAKIGGDLLGAHFQEESNEDARTLQRETTAVNNQLQKDFAQQGVRWRVEDAKAAGLHPLFALTGQGAQFTPSAISIDGRSPTGDAFSRAGQHLGEALQRQENAKEATARLRVNEALAAANIEKDLAQANYYNSMAARTRNGATPTMPDMGDGAGWVGGSGSVVHQGASNTPMLDRREIVPSQNVSASSNDTAVESGGSPHWKQYTLDNSGLTIQLPAGSGPSEAYESMAESPTLLGFVIARNVSVYGAKWLTKFMQMYGNLFEALKPRIIDQTRSAIEAGREAVREKYGF